MRINHNIPALYAYNSVNATNSAMQKSIQKLSSGLRINTAADDAAGLSISEKMRSQIRGMDQAIGNSQDGINMIQTAEGALNETTSILQRMRELSVQAANDTLTANDRQAVQSEIDQLTEEIDRISDTTQFNKKKLLNGDSAALVSTDNLDTKVFVRGGLREIDQFGQKSAAEGNYKISIEAEAGTAQVQKTDIFKIKHANQGHLAESTTGFANFEGTLAGGPLSADDSFTIRIDGDSYTFGFTTGALNAATMATFKADIEGTAGLSDKVEITTGTVVGTFTIVNKDAGEDFEVAWNLNAATIAETGGLAATDATDLITVSSDNDNVVEITMDAADMMVGDYKVETYISASGAFTATAVAFTYEQDGKNGFVTSAAATFGVATGAENMSLAIEVDSIDTAAGSITFSYKYIKVLSDGSGSVAGNGGVTLTAVGGGMSLTGVDFGGVSFTAFDLASGVSSFSVGDKAVINVLASGANTMDRVVVERTNGTSVVGAMQYNFDNDALKNETVDFSFFQLNTISSSADYGELKSSTVSLKVRTLENANSGDYGPAAAPTGRDYAASFTIDKNAIGDIADSTSKIYDVDKFWDSNGNFMVEDPQTLTLVQGDGSKTSVTIYKDDTMDDIASKLNDAIRDGLGQGDLEGLENSDDFVHYVTKAEAEEKNAAGELVNADTPYSVAGTFVISSAINGSEGEITFVGDEEFINALSLNEIQKSEENRYTVDVTDAHTGASVAEDVEITGNKLVGVVHNNVDIEFNNMADLDVEWNDTTHEWKATNALNSYETTVHLADNTTVFQIGANEKEDMGINIGNMSAESLGVDNILVTDRENAARSITVIDDAIERVSSQRSTLGAYQNRLEHTIANLTTGSTNITAAESRIRDVDMAKEMMKYTSLNVLMQAGNSMLGQANQLPQNVLGLLR